MLSPFKRTPDAGLAPVPSLADVSPEYAALLKQQATLQARCAAALTELREIVKRGDGPALHSPTAADIERGRRVEALLKGEKYDARSAPLYESPPSRYSELHREIADIREFALPQIETKLRAAAAAASTVIREQFKDVHRQIVRDTAVALRALHDANVRYWSFSDALNKEGVAWGALGPAFVRPIGHPEDRQGPLGQWFRDALADGHISKSDIPESLR